MSPTTSSKPHAQKLGTHKPTQINVDPKFHALIQPNLNKPNPNFNFEHVGQWGLDLARPKLHPN